MKTQSPFALAAGQFEQAIHAPADSSRVAERLTVLEVMADLNSAYNALRQHFFLGSGDMEHVAHQVARAEVACLRMRDLVPVRLIDVERDEILKAAPWREEGGS